jgi:heptosyltransferase-2
MISKPLPDATIGNAVTPHVLLVPKGFLGDILLTSPVIEVLKQCAVPPRISVLCSPSLAKLVSRDPLVDGVIVFDRKGEHRGMKGLGRLAEKLRGERFDRVYSFHRSPRTSMLLWRARIKERVAYTDAFLGFLYSRRVQRSATAHEVVRNLQLVAADLQGEAGSKVEQLVERGELHDGAFARLRAPEPRDEELSPKVCEVLGDASPYILIAPGSAWETKQWSPERFRELAAEIVRRGTRVVITGAPSDQSACDAVARDLPGALVFNLCGETTVLEIVRLVKGARALVCNDSLALHIASAVQTPTVAVFCATSPAFGFGPWQNKAVVVERRDLFCKPCRRHGSRKCPTGTRMCMTGVSSAQVLRPLEDFMVEQGVWNRGSANGCV